MHIKTRDKIYDVLVRAGYNYHFTEEEGFIKVIKNKQRFHIILNDDYSGDIHIDKTVNGKHKTIFPDNVLGKEKHQIKKYDIKVDSKLNKIETVNAKYLNTIQKRKVTKRSIFNPMRYFLGKFKYTTIC